MANDLKVHEKLLLAAADLTDAGQRTFSAEDLVVAAWRRDPHTFGLAGHVDDAGQPKYPNSNRVFAEIMGSKPIRARGLLMKAGTKMFRLTEAGVQQSAALRNRDRQTGGAKKVSFTRETSVALRRLLSSRAVQKYLDDRQDDITFHDASSFWGITARSSAMEFKARTGHVEAVLTAAAAAAEDEPITLAHGAQPLSHDDIENLLELHDSMLKKFDDEIVFIRRRTDERA